MGNRRKDGVNVIILKDLSSQGVFIRALCISIVLRTLNIMCPLQLRPSLCQGGRAIDEPN